MKVIGIYPQLVKSNNLITRSTTGEPIGLGIMLSIAKSLGHSIKYIPLIDTNIKNIFKEIKEFNPDICLFSFMTAQYNLAKQIAYTLKNYNSQIKIIAGGYHPSSANSIEYPFDYFVKGEGEDSIVNILHEIERKNISKSSNELIKSVGPIFNSKHRINISKKYYWPVRNQKSLSNKYYGLIYPCFENQQSFAYIEYGRGCYYNCNYCCKSSMFKGNKINFRNIKDVVDEIKYLIDYYGTNILFFTDLNFTADPIKVEQLCSEIINTGIKVSWFCMSNLSTVTPSLLQMMKKAGCVKIMYGIETVSSELSDMTKKNSHVDTFKTLFDTINAGILVHLFYVIGFPWETVDSIKESIPLISKLPGHQLRIAVATPLPGSKWYKELEQEKLIDDFNLYDTEHFVFKSDRTKQNQLDEVIKMIYKQFYLSDNYINRIKDIVNIDSNYIESFSSFFNELNRISIINRKHLLELQSNLLNPHSQAHLQFAQANTQAKIAKELVCLPPHFCRR